MHRLGCSAVHIIFLDQGSNLCVWHWQVVSYSLYLQGRPIFNFWWISIFFSVVAAPPYIPTNSVGFQVVLVVKNLPANAGDLRDMDSIPGSGRYPGGGHSNLLQCSCLENPIIRGAWWAAVHRVTELDITEVTELNWDKIGNQSRDFWSPGRGLANQGSSLTTFHCCYL